MAKSYVPTTESKLLGFLDDLDTESLQGREGWRDSSNWDRYVQLSRGQQIFGKNENPIFRADIASPAVNRKTAMLTESEPILDVSARRPGLDGTAEIIKQWVLCTWQKQSVQMSLEAIRAYMGAMGCAGLRITWDKDADYKTGDIRLPAQDPRVIRFDPSVIKAYEMDRAAYIGPMEAIRQTWELKRAYPDKADKIKGSKFTALVGDQAKSGGYTGKRGAITTPVGLSRTRGSVGGRNSESGAIPRTKVKEYWVADPATDKKGNPLWPGGRLFTRCGDGGEGEDVVVNFDENPDNDRTANPYFDGLWDLEWLDNIPDLDHPYGRSEIGAVRYLQEAFNRIGNLIVKNGLRNGAPIIFAATGALPPDKIAELKALEMLVIEYQMGRDVRRDQPAIAPEVQLQMMQLILQLTDFVLGTGEATQQPGKGRQEVRSADQLEGLQQAGQVLVKAEARRLEGFLERVGKKLISRFFQYQTDDRLMTYYGGGESFQKFTFERAKLMQQIQMYGAQKALKDARKARGKEALPNQDELVEAMLYCIKGAWRDFDMNIVPLSSLAGTKIQRAMLKFQLAQAVMIPKRDVLAEIGVANPEEKVREAASEMIEHQALGIPPPSAAPGKGGKKKQGAAA